MFLVMFRKIGVLLSFILCIGCLNILSSVNLFAQQSNLEIRVAPSLDPNIITHAGKDAKKIRYVATIENHGNISAHDVLFFDGVIGDSGAIDGIYGTASYDDGNSGIQRSQPSSDPSKDIRWVQMGILNEGTMSANLSGHNGLYGKDVYTMADLNANGILNEQGYEQGLNMDFNGDANLSPDTVVYNGYYGIIGEIKPNEKITIHYEITYIIEKFVNKDGIPNRFNIVYYNQDRTFPDRTPHYKGIPGFVPLNTTTDRNISINYTPVETEILVIKNYTSSIGIKIQNTGSLRTEFSFFTDDHVFNSQWIKSIKEKSKNALISDLGGNISVFKDNNLVTENREVIYDGTNGSITLDLEAGEYIELISNVTSPDSNASNTTLKFELDGEHKTDNLVHSVMYSIVKPEVNIAYNIYPDSDCNGILNNPKPAQIDPNHNEIINTMVGKCFVSEIVFKNATTHEFVPQSVKIRQDLLNTNHLEYIRESIQYCISTNHPCNSESDFIIATDEANNRIDGATYSVQNQRVNFILKHIFKNEDDPDNPGGKLATGNNGALSSKASGVFRYGFKVIE